MTVKEVGKVTRVGKDDTSTIIKQVYPLPYGFEKKKRLSKGKLSDDQVRFVRSEFANNKDVPRKEFIRQLAKQIGASYKTVECAIYRTTYKHVE